MGLLKSMFLAAGLLSGIAAPASAQFTRPPDDVPYGGQGGYVQPAQQDAAGLLLRIDRLENALRTLNGQIEQLQFQNRRLEEQLQKFQRDVDFRFQEQGGGRRPAPASTPPQRRGDVAPEGNAPSQSAEIAPPPASGGMTPQQILPPAQRGDVFDPAASPEAPGAPQPLGSTAPSTPLNTARVQGAPALPGGPIIVDEEEEDGGSDPSAPLDLRRPGAGLPGAPSRDHGVPAAPRSVSSIQPGAGVGPRDDYTAAVTALRAGQYETAENGLKGYIQNNPTDRFVPDAVYYLGESYAQRGRHREAAEQYLKVSTDYAKSSRAPDGMLRLGTSLVALGAKEQACATYGEIARKYPNATNVIRNADAQMKKAKC